MVKKESNELYFVQVREPSEIRKRILETLKEIVEMLQRFERFKKIRHEKIEKINHLRVLLRQGNKMLGDLRGKMPQTNLRATLAREKPAAPNYHQKKKAKRAEEKAPKKEKTELEKLETELSAIEGKLKSLT